MSVTRNPLKITSKTILTLLATSLLVLLIGSSCPHLLETLNAVITVADLHAVASAILLVPSGASCEAWSTSSTSGLTRAFTGA
jgi:hypothetical protein